MNFNGNNRRPIKERIAEFMYGRNGIDDLYHFLFWVIIILSLVNLYFKSWVLSSIGTLILVYAAFRVLSKNVYRRQNENKFYLTCLGKIRGVYRRARKIISSRLDVLRSRWRDRKTHVYRRCPQCKNTLRLPKSRGKHTAACPCCDARFDITIF